MKAFPWREFRPTVLFLGKFLAIYLAGNLLYGLYITSFHPKPDPVTRHVTQQVSGILSVCGWETNVYDSKRKPTTIIGYSGRSVIGVYEGCNGLNTMIIFVAFVIAFGPYKRSMLWFILAGLAVIHLVNLGRVLLLFFVAEYQPGLMYFTHKYFFTAILYAVIFLLWLLWVKKNSLKKDAEQKA